MMLFSFLGKGYDTVFRRETVSSIITILIPPCGSLFQAGEMKPNRKNIPRREFTVSHFGFNAPSRFVPARPKYGHG